MTEPFMHPVQQVSGGSNWSTAGAEGKAALDELDRIEDERAAIERERKMLADELAERREASEGLPSVDRGRALLKAVLEIRTRGWEYELRSSPPLHADDGELLRIGGHEAEVRVPHGPEATVVAFDPDVALNAALRGVLAALAHQDPRR